MPFIRTLLIALLIACGAFLLAVGLEVPIPYISWHAVPARDIPIGILLVLAGIAVTRYWIPPQDESQLVEEWKRSRKHSD
jgi:amino acid transporter